MAYVDDFTKECLPIIPAFWIAGAQTTRILYSIALSQGCPATIRTAQDATFTGRTLAMWSWFNPVGQASAEQIHCEL